MAVAAVAVSLTCARAAPAAEGAGERARLAPCSVVSDDAVRHALGVLSESRVVGPMSVSAGTCSWHSDDPGCSLRALGVAVHNGRGARAAFDAANARSLPFDHVRGIGDDAFYLTEPMPPGAPVMIERFDVRDGDGWVEYTMLGRLNPEGSRPLLVALAASAATRVKMAP